MRKLLLLFLLSACGAKADLPDIGSAVFPQPDVNVAVSTGDKSSATAADVIDNEFTEIDYAPSGTYAGSGAPEPAPPQGNGVLYRAEPQKACTNGDAWITVHGDGLRHGNEPSLIYVATGETHDLGPDDCGEARFHWLDMRRFEIRPPSGLVSGYYLIGFGGAANDVALNLQWCSDPVEPTCE